MATYKEIKGVTVQTKDEDPVVNAGSWSSGGSLNTARYRGGSSGTTTAGLVYTGRTPTYVGNTESYNGTSWTEVNDVNNNSYAGGGSPAGSYTAAIKSSGKSGPSSFQTNTEIWDGTNWTEVNNNNTARDGIMGAGTSTSNIIAGGQTPPNQVIAESWDGTSWTEVGDLNNAKGFGVSWGSSNSNAIVATGEGDGSSPDGYGSTAETWNGSSWTATTSLNQGRTQGGGFGSTSTDGLIAGGYYGPGYQTSVESFDGSAWTEVNDLSVARGLHFGSGTNGQVGFVAGGNPVKSDTEEWAFPPPTAAILTEGSIFLSGGTTLKGFGKAAGIPAGTWASGGALNTARATYDSMNGTQSASKAISGFTPPDNSLTSVEDYNGTSWTETTEVNTARYSGGAAGDTSASSILFGGYIPTPPSYVTNTETWNGSSWTEVNELNTARGNVGGNGAQNSALCYGGQPLTGKTESWDGTSWTEVSDLNRTRHDVASAGANNTSALAAGGEYPPNVRTDHVETWDGSSWTEVNELNTARSVAAGSGTKDLAMAFGGSPNGSTVVSNSEAWNGSSWTEIAELGTARRTLAGSGSAATGLAAGGVIPPSVSALTEEFTADSALSTITVS